MSEEIDAETQCSLYAHTNPGEACLSDEVAVPHLAYIQNLRVPRYLRHSWSYKTHGFFFYLVRVFPFVNARRYYRRMESERGCCLNSNLVCVPSSDGWLESSRGRRPRNTLSMRLRRGVNGRAVGFATYWSGIHRASSDSLLPTTSNLTPDLTQISRTSRRATQYKHPHAMSGMPASPPLRLTRRLCSECGKETPCHHKMLRRARRPLVLRSLVLVPQIRHTSIRSRCQHFPRWEMSLNSAGQPSRPPPNDPHLREGHSDQG